MASVFSLSQKAITTLEPSHLSEYQGEETLDLSGNDIRFLPDFLADLNFKTLIISNNHRYLAQHLIFKCPSWLKDSEINIEAYGIGLVSTPTELKGRITWREASSYS